MLEPLLDEGRDVGADHREPASRPSLLSRRTSLGNGRGRGGRAHGNDVGGRAESLPASVPVRVAVPRNGGLQGGFGEGRSSSGRDRLQGGSNLVLSIPEGTTTNSPRKSLYMRGS